MDATGCVVRLPETPETVCLNKLFFFATQTVYIRTLLTSRLSSSNAHFHELYMVVCFTGEEISHVFKMMYSLFSILVCDIGYTFA